jgi:hypothetical protein
MKDADSVFEDKVNQELSKLSERLDNIDLLIQKRTTAIIQLI